MFDVQRNVIDNALQGSQAHHPEATVTNVSG